MSVGITGGRERDRRGDEMENIKGCGVSASLLFVFFLSSRPDLQTIYIALGKCSEWEKGRKKNNHIQVNDKTYNRPHDLRVIYKVPFRLKGVRKRREKQKHKKGKTFSL